ncbi:unnamed protein product [Ceratitis capitata]|uniref:(Mediterranean fruit fly) hypothetical protein n=1 Tax=Ceratitis capitata TaxID=7213 RepID=A0A811U535_CERCA|nr:unnamed protein product [Ceratitis capitata]
MLPNKLVVIYCQPTTQEQRPNDNTVITNSRNKSKSKNKTKNKCRNRNSSRNSRNKNCNNCDSNNSSSNISDRHSSTSSNANTNNHTVNDVDAGHASIKYKICIGQVCVCVSACTLSVLTSKLSSLQQAITHPVSVPDQKQRTPPPTPQRVEQQSDGQQKQLERKQIRLQQQVCKRRSRTLTKLIIKAITKTTIPPAITNNTYPLPLLPAHFRRRQRRQRRRCRHLHTVRWPTRAIELYAPQKQTQKQKQKYWIRKFANIIRKYEFNYCRHCATNGPQGIYGKPNTIKITR